MYYKGQAIREIANTYAENGNYEIDSRQIIRMLARELNDSDFNSCREQDWFAEILKQVK